MHIYPEFNMNTKFKDGDIWFNINTKDVYQFHKDNKIEPWKFLGRCKCIENNTPMLFHIYECKDMQFPIDKL
jgi:hypothetical protein